MGDLDGWIDDSFEGLKDYSDWKTEQEDNALITDPREHNIDAQAEDEPDEPDPDHIFTKSIRTSPVTHKSYDDPDLQIAALALAEAGWVAEANSLPMREDDYDRLRHEVIAQIDDRYRQELLGEALAAIMAYRMTQHYQRAKAVGLVFDLMKRTSEATNP